MLPERLSEIPAIAAIRAAMVTGYATGGTSVIPDGWEMLIADFVAYLAAIGRPATTIALRRGQLEHLARSVAVAPTLVTLDLLTGWFSTQQWKPETRRSMRAAVRGFFSWAHENGHVEVDPSARMPQIRVPRASARPCPEQTYRQALMKATPRQALMLRLAAEAGLRRAEIAKVHVDDLTGSPGRYSLLVHGKGANERVIPINDGLAADIARAENWLFPSLRGEHLTPRAVGVICSELLGEGVTLHMLRHRFATRAYRATRNIRAVQRMLGHSSLAITERYLECDDDEMRAAMLGAA